MLTLLIILNIILAAASVIFLIKRLLINFIWSQKTIKNIIMSICVIIALFSSFGCLYMGFIIDENKQELEYELTKSEGVIINKVAKADLIKDDLIKLDLEIDKVKRYTGVGYLCFISGFLIYRNIINENNKIKPQGKWDLKNFK